MHDDSKNGQINGISLTALCRALGPGWAWRQDDMGWTRIEHADLAPGYLHLSVPWNQKSRVVASAHGQKISVAAERGPLVLAAEINRRLMPAARLDAEKERATQARERAEHQARTDLAGRLAALAGQPSAAENVSKSDRQRRVYLSGNDWTLDVDVYNNAAHASVKGRLRADDLEAMLALLVERVEARRLAEHGPRVDLAAE